MKKNVSLKLMMTIKDNLRNELDKEFDKNKELIQKLNDLCPEK